MIENVANSKLSQSLPDVALEKPELSLSGALDWVGMSGIEVPVNLKDGQGQVYRTPARADAFVSLENQNSRGIHMSRLFKELQQALTTSTLSFLTLDQILHQFLLTHDGLSQKARLEIEFQALVQRQALKSTNQGWRTYPVRLSGELHRGQKARFYLETVVIYSSTCPASAALSRNLIQENFKNHFRGQELDLKNVSDFLGTTQGILATPHAQRSEARVKIEIAGEFHFEKLIDVIEDILQTPVQTMVKREDEQEFALRNGQNLMFCEDAARRIQRAMLAQPEILDFIAQLRHFESLHPHDAVSVVSRGRDLQNFNWGQ